ncbi:MAG TPA: hypothetical protein VMY59_01260 [Candidatus Thermoplasmatota archaeon]|nr:hypothetical protein [Candidatus Thermoplasmatota archaeon]
MKKKMIEGLDCVLCGKPAQTLHHPEQEEYNNLVEYFNAENQIPVCHWCHSFRIHPEKLLDPLEAESFQRKYLIKELKEKIIKERYEKGEIPKELYEKWMKDSDVKKGTYTKTIQLLLKEENKIDPESLFMRDNLIEGLDCVLCGEPAQTLHYPEENYDDITVYNEAENLIPVCHVCHLCKLHPEKLFDPLSQESIQKYILKGPIDYQNEKEILFRERLYKKIEEILEETYRKGEMKTKEYFKWKDFYLKPNKRYCPKCGIEIWYFAKSCVNCGNDFKS